MTKICTKAVTLYDVGDDWRVEVIRREDGWREAWLFHKDYGVKDLMFGVQSKGQELLDMIEANLSDYINFYKEQYFCEV